MPLELSDSEMSLLLSLSATIEQQRRPQFLQEVRRYFDPPQLPNASPVHRGSAARRLGVDKRPAGDERVGGDRRSSFTRKLDRATTPEGRAKPETRVAAIEGNGSLDLLIAAAPRERRRKCVID
jgi:hypothetical protein